MIPEEVLKELFCVLSAEKHFLENPISLSCGYSACRKCIGQCIGPINCLGCEQQHTVDLSAIKDSSLFKVTFESYASDLFELVYDQFSSSYETLKSKVFRLFYGLFKNLIFYFD